MTLLVHMNKIRVYHGVSCGGDILVSGLALLGLVMFAHGQFDGVLKHSFSEGK